MNSSALRKRGYYLEGTTLHTPSGQISLAGIRGVDVCDTSPALVWRLLGFFVILNVSTLIVYSTGPGAVAGFLIFFYGIYWYASSTKEVRVFTQKGSFPVAKLRACPLKFWDEGHQEVPQNLADLIKPLAANSK